MTRAEIAEAFLSAALGLSSYATTASWLEAIAEFWWRDCMEDETPWTETDLAKMASVLKAAALLEATACLS
jgi:hypothetical protein